MTQSTANQFILPGGNLNDFTSVNGGTFEFSSNVTASLPLNSVYNNIEFSGTGNKNLAITGILVNGDFIISAGTVVNVSNQEILLSGNWLNQVGTSGWQGGGSGRVFLIGANQNITGATSFSNLIVNGGGFKTLNSSITVNNLTLGNGIIVTGNNEISVPATGDITGESVNSYINGYLRRFVPAGTLTMNFEVGDASGYTPITVSFNGSPSAGGNILASSVQLATMPRVYTSGINQNKSLNRTYEQLTASSLTGFTSYNATFNFLDSDIDVGANALNFHWSSLKWFFLVKLRASYDTYTNYTTLNGLNWIWNFPNWRRDEWNHLDWCCKHQLEQRIQLACQMKFLGQMTIYSCRTSYESTKLHFRWKWNLATI
jgi:hypothetical protein